MLEHALPHEALEDMPHGVVQPLHQDDRVGPVVVGVDQDGQRVFPGVKAIIDSFGKYMVSNPQVAEGVHYLGHILR